MMDSIWNETDLTNSSRNSPDFVGASADHIIRVIWLSFVFVFGTVGNILLFAVILRRGKITNVTNLFNLNLAVADLIRIFLFIPAYLIYSAQDKWPPWLGLPGCKFVFMILQSSLTTSILTLLFMSMERFRAVVHPLKKQMSIRLARYLVVTAWCVGFIASLWFARALRIATEDNGQAHCCLCSEKTWLTTGLLVLFISTQWLPGALFTVAYIKIILKLRRDGVINPSDISQSSQNRHRRNLRAARILVIEVVFFIGCLFPFYQYTIATATGNGSAAGALTPEGMIVFCMMMTYSLTNPFCHILLNREFREEVRRMSQQIKRFCGVESKQISWWDTHLPGWHLTGDETRQNEERNHTNGSGK